MTVLTDTFTLERVYDASVSEVWRCWTDPELRAKWFRGPAEWVLIERSQDFRVGGREVLRGRLPSGTETFFSSTFHVIAPERYLITDYDMHVGGAMMSVSLATLELEPAAGGKCTLRYVEQGAFFDGNPSSPASRKGGVSWHLDNLAEVLAARAR